MRSTFPKSELIERAIEFSEEKHKGQFRKFENKPYSIHPKRVAYILYQFKISKNIEYLIASAYLHDTVEDTDTTIEDIENLFGTFVAGIVRELTSSTEEIGKIGKARYLANKMVNMSSYALTLKLADRIDNVNRLQWAPEKFKNKYLSETTFIIKMLELKRNLNNTQKIMINEIKKHLSEDAEDNIDYLNFDSYMRRNEIKK